MKKSLIVLSFGIFCLFYNPQLTVAQDGQNGIAPVQSMQPTFRPVLRRGSFGDDVMRLQEILQNLGYDTGRPDGDFGPRTERAVVAFQDDNGLLSSGVVDQDTWNTIDSVVADSNGPPIHPRPEPVAPYSTPDQIIRLANSVAFNLIGKTEQEAERIIGLINEIMTEVGSVTQFELRIIRENGRDYPGTDDYRVSRFNLTIIDGRIMAIDIG